MKMLAEQCGLHESYMNVERLQPAKAGRALGPPAMLLEAHDAAARVPSTSSLLPFGHLVAQLPWTTIPPSPETGLCFVLLIASC